MSINLEEEIANDELYKKYFVPGSILSSVQVLRSASEWSAGIKKTENSILQAYYDLIYNAKHYIYIENQFFISKAWTDEEMKKCPYLIRDIVKNEIALLIRKRIERAYIKKENFKVFIFIPLLPGFEGEPEKSRTLQIIMKHTYATICRNYGLSIIEELNKVMGNKWKDYIGFYSLRNHGLVNNVPKTEILYIHSKLMIVDDTKVLIGSANINDRSMLGIRDSEFAVLINENRSIINKKNNKNFIMDGKIYKGANFAISFRKSLMAEHLGLNEDDPILEDPVDNKLFSLITSRANSNTIIYRNIFRCYPDDTFTNFEILNQAQKLQESINKSTLLQNYLKSKDKIIGHIVEFPLNFLKEEELGRIYFTKENLVPEHNFT
jgi:phospholipase D1/2